MADGTGTIAQVRALIGDGDSQWFQDEEIQAYLDITGDNALRAAGTALQNMAVSFAVSGRSIKTDDLSIDTRDRATSLISLSKQYFAQADEADALAAQDIFIVGRTGRPHGRHHSVDGPLTITYNAGYGNGGYGE